MRFRVALTWARALITMRNPIFAVLGEVCICLACGLRKEGLLAIVGQAQQVVAPPSCGKAVYVERPDFVDPGGLSAPPVSFVKLSQNESIK